MELYKGRQPKLLPCFHTFCLPCLFTLEEKAKKQLTPAEDPGHNTDSTVSVTICCPTCRKDVSVPSGGVAAFQANFYVDDGGDETTRSKPVLCDLCDGNEEADFCCSKCQYVCARCIRAHNKFCQSELTSLKQKSSDNSIAALMDKAKGQVEVLDAALTKLAEKEKHLDQEKRALDDTINTLYCTALRYLADARDGAFSSLRDATQTERDKLQAEMIAAHSLKTKLSEAILHGTSGQDLQSAFMSKTDIEQYECLVKGSEQEPFFEHERGTSVILQMPEYCQVFMGRISSARQQPILAVAHEETAQAADMTGTTAKSVTSQLSAARKTENSVEKAEGQWQAKLGELGIQVAQLDKKAQNLQDENRSLRHDLISSQEKNAKFFSDFATMQREFVAMRDKNSIMCQDMAVAQTEKDKLFEQLASVRAENAKLQGKYADVCKEITSVKSEIRAEVATVNSNLKSDTASSQREVSSLQRKVTSLQNSVNKITTLEQRITRSSSQVAFQAKLSSDVTTTSERVLYLKDVIFSVGGGYNGQTGIFTAPVTGVYMFMATASPNKSKEDIDSRLDIVLENKRTAHLTASGTNLSTCHAAVKVQAGQKVWLRTFNTKSTFCSGFWTSFTGVLIQPEV